MTTKWLAKKKLKVETQEQELRRQLDELQQRENLLAVEVDSLRHTLESYARGYVPRDTLTPLPGQSIREWHEARVRAEQAPEKPPATEQEWLESLTDERDGHEWDLRKIEAVLTRHGMHISIGGQTTAAWRMAEWLEQKLMNDHYKIEGLQNDRTFETRMFAYMQARCYQEVVGGVRCWTVLDEQNTGDLKTVLLDLEKRDEQRQRDAVLDRDTGDAGGGSTGGADPDDSPPF